MPDRTSTFSPVCACAFIPGKINANTMKAIQSWFMMAVSPRSQQIRAQLIARAFECEHVNHVAFAPRRGCPVTLLNHFCLMLDRAVRGRRYSRHHEMYFSPFRQGETD